MGTLALHPQWMEGLLWAKTCANVLRLGQGEVEAQYGPKELALRQGADCGALRVGRCEEKQGLC